MVDRALFWRTLAVLGVVIGSGPLAVDTALPAVRAMAEGLGTDTGTIQAALSAYVFGIASGQLVFGTLSDRFGRRPTMMWGIAGYVVAAILLSLSSTIEPVLVLRFIQGIGSSAVFVISRAVVRDLFAVEDSARMFAILFFVLSMFPVIYPIIGGVLTEAIGWRAVFVFMAAVSGLGLLLIALFLRESLPRPDYGALSFGRFFGSAGELLRDTTFRGYLLVGIGAYVGLCAVLGGMPLVVIGYLGETPTTFGYLYAVVMVIHMLAAALGGRLVSRLGIPRMTALGASIVALAGAGAVIAVASGGLTTTTIVAANAAVMIGFAFANPSMTAGALSNFRHMAGRATALLGFLQHSSGALTIFLIGIADDGTPRPYAVAMASAGILALGGYLAFVRPLTPKAA